MFIKDTYNNANTQRAAAGRLFGLWLIAEYFPYKNFHSPRQPPHRYGKFFRERLYRSSCSLLYTYRSICQVFARAFIDLGFCLGEGARRALTLSRRESCARMGGRARAYSRGLWGKRIGFAPSGISARASTPLDERRRSLAMQKFSSGSDTTKSILKTRKGVVRGRTPKERGGARSWGEDSFSSPQTVACPSQPPAGGIGEETQAT